jgi:hypothetical protein
MELRRYVGLVDLGIATLVLVAVLLPDREMYASPAHKADDRTQFSLALAEARSIASPKDGAAIAAFSRKLGEAGFKDWAIENAVTSSERAKDSPTRWRALLAASLAYVDRVDAIAALDYANQALAACEASAQTCPSAEEVRMQFYQASLDAGVKSGIDPHKDPKGFRRAGEAALRQGRILHGEHGERGSNSAPP